LVPRHIADGHTSRQRGLEPRRLATSCGWRISSHVQHLHSAALLPRCASGVPHQALQL